MEKNGTVSGVGNTPFMDPNFECVVISSFITVGNQKHPGSSMEADHDPGTKTLRRRLQQTNQGKFLVLNVTNMFCDFLLIGTIESIQVIS